MSTCLRFLQNIVVSFCPTAPSPSALMVPPSPASAKSPAARPPRSHSKKPRTEAQHEYTQLLLPDVPAGGIALHDLRQALRTALFKPIDVVQALFNEASHAAGVDSGPECHGSSLSLPCLFRRTDRAALVAILVATLLAHNCGIGPVGVRSILLWGSQKWTDQLLADFHHDPRGLALRHIHLSGKTAKFPDVELKVRFLFWRRGPSEDHCGQLSACPGLIALRYLLVRRSPPPPPPCTADTPPR